MARPNIFISHSLDLEESADFHEILEELAAIAGETAFSESQALQLPKVFATQQEIILQDPDGSQKVLSTAAAEKHDAFFQPFTPETWRK
jgi:hypothetical protein